MARQDIHKITGILEQSLGLMKQAGADYALASVSTHQQTSVKVRNGRLESLQSAQPVKITLSMRIGDKSESLSLSSGSLDDLRSSVGNLAQAVKRMPDNLYDRPADASRISKVRNNLSLDLIDRTRVSLAQLIESSMAVEAAAMSVAGVSLSKGGSASWYRALNVSLNSRGERFVSEGTGSSLGVTVIAKDQNDQRTGSEGSSAAYCSDLMTPAEIGLIAGSKAVQALNPGKARPGKFPVAFHPDIGASLLGHFISAIDGTAIRKKSSFLTECMKQTVFATGITIADNPLLPRGHESTRFSGSGMPAQFMTVVDRGVLKAWFMNLEDARRLGFENEPQIRGETNITIEPGRVSPAHLIDDIQEGLYVTGLMGQGIDLTSGQYSRAATGFRIRNGKVDYGQPVANASISSSLQDMFRNMIAANDLNRMRSSVAVPTLRIEGMTIA